MFYETWERLKDLIQKCPHRAIPKWQLVQYFYDGLSEKHRQMVDSSCGGTFKHKSEQEACQLFKTLSENSLHYMSTTSREAPRLGSKRGGMYEVSHSVDIHSKMVALSQKLNRLLQVSHTSSPSAQSQDACIICLSPTHTIGDCPVAH